MQRPRVGDRAYRVAYRVSEHGHTPLTLAIIQEEGGRVSLPLVLYCVCAHCHHEASYSHREESGHGLSR